MFSLNISRAFVLGDGMGLFLLGCIGYYYVKYTFVMQAKARHIIGMCDIYIDQDLPFKWGYY